MHATRDSTLLGYAGEEFLIEDSLVNLEKEFGDYFLRVHRNALVATRSITGVEKNPSGSWQINLGGTETKLDVSRRHTAADLDIPAR